MTSSKDERTPFQESGTRQKGLDAVAKVFDMQLRVGYKPGGRHGS
jgi:hypothetical protein